MHYAFRITSLYYLTHLQSQSNPIVKWSENCSHELIVEMKNAFFKFSKLYFRMGSPQGANGILEENVAKFTDLWYPIPAAFVVICFRLFFERYVLCMMIFSTLKWSIKAMGGLKWALILWVPISCLSWQVKIIHNWTIWVKISLY